MYGPHEVRPAEGHEKGECVRVRGRGDGKVGPGSENHAPQFNEYLAILLSAPIFPFFFCLLRPQTIRSFLGKIGGLNCRQSSLVLEVSAVLSLFSSSFFLLNFSFFFWIFWLRLECGDSVADELCACMCFLLF